MSSAEYRLFYRALSQKRPIILSILLTKATPYNTWGVESFFPQEKGPQKKEKKKEKGKIQPIADKVAQNLEILLLKLSI